MKDEPTARIPPDFAQAMIAMRGESGRAWIDALPGIIADRAAAWSFRVGAPFPRLSFNYAAAVERADGKRAVLKIGYPADKEFLTEIEALEHFAGHGMVQMLEVDIEQRVMLLERLEPGRSLLDVEDDVEATAIAAEVMQQLWRPVPENHAFPSISDWGQGFQRMRRRFDGGTGPLPSRMTERAERLFVELVGSQATPVLLHGDLNLGNVLSATRRPWLAIDPKGVIGEPAYEIGVWLRDPLPQLLQDVDPARTLARRIDHFAEALQLDRARIRDWGIAQAVLSAWWTIEDNSGEIDDTIACAELLSSLPG